MIKPVILIPTYNESMAIVELLHALATIQNQYSFDVVILDDNSPDKTADIAQSLGYSWVSVIRRPGKAGLGAAYRAGFAAAVSYTHLTLPTKRIV